MLSLQSESVLKSNKTFKNKKNVLKSSNMKRVIFFFFLMATVCVNAQTAKSSTNARTNRYEQKVDSLLSEIDSLQSISSRYLEYMAMRFLPKERYKLYQTENIYNVLILDNLLVELK